MRNNAEQFDAALAFELKCKLNRSTVNCNIQSIGGNKKYSGSHLYIRSNCRRISFS